MATGRGARDIIIGMRTCKPWSREELESVLERFKTEPAKAIAQSIGRTPKSIYHVANNNGVLKTTEALSAIHKANGIPYAALLKQFKPKHGMAGAKFGGRLDATYSAWKSMRARCTQPDRKDFPRYGGRGITICERWTEFANFLSDMGRRPAGMSLGRIDNDGNYEPGNCRWETASQQARNRNSTVYLEAFGRRQCLATWAEEYGIRADTLMWRIDSGRSPEKALTDPVKTPRRTR